MQSVKLNKSSLHAISRQIKKMQTENESAKAKLASAISGLDFEVASKQNIQNSLNKLNKSLVTRISLAERYESAFLNVTDSIISADSNSGNKSQSILERIKNYIEGKVGQIKNFFINSKVGKYALSAGLFLTGASILTTTILGPLLETFAVFNWITSIRNKKGIGVVHAEGETHTTSEKEKDIQRQAREKQEVADEYNAKLKRVGYSDEQIDNMKNNAGDSATLRDTYDQALNSATVKAYEGSGKDLTEGAYGDFNVVSGFDDKYVLNQMDYNLIQTGGSNGGCTSTSDAMVGSFKHGEYYNPEDDWPGPGKGGARWTHTQSIEGSGTWSTEQRYTEIYNQINNNGNAVVIRVTGHSMAAVGVRNGCDPANMTANDVLVANPGNGKICTLQEYLDKSGRSLDNSWSLRIPR